MLWLVVTTVMGALVVAGLAGSAGWKLVDRWRDPFKDFATPEEARRVSEHAATGLLALAAAWGLSRLLDAVYPETGVDVSMGSVGVGVLAALAAPAFGIAAWWLVTRRLGDQPEERDHPAWEWHVVGVVAVALAMVLLSVDGLLTWAVGEQLGIARNITRLVPWAALLVGYAALATRLLPRRRHHTTWLAASVVGLVMATTGLARLLGSAGDGLAVVLADAGTVDWTTLAAPAVTAVVGGIAWRTTWAPTRRTGRSRHLSAWLLVAISGGMLGVALGTYAILVDGLTWSLGERTGSAIEHFSAAPGAVAAIVVGAMVWAHHRGVLGPAALRRRPELVRVQQYLATAAGVVATAVGGITVLASVVDLAAGGELVQELSSRSATVLPDVALLLVGAVLWSSQWGETQRAANASSRDFGPQVETPAGMHGIAAPPSVVTATGDAPIVAEQASPTRRVFLAAVTVAASVVAFAALIQTGLVGSRQAVGAGADALATLRAVALPLSTLLVSGAVAARHGVVWLRDRDTPVGERGTFPGRILLVGPPDDEIVDELAAVTGAQVQLHPRQDGQGRPWQADAVASSLHELEHDHVLVLAESRGVTLIPLGPSSG